MKKKLAPEALYSSRHYDRTSHAKSHCHIGTMERLTAADIGRIDPNGDRALALLNEFKKPSHKKP